MSVKQTILGIVGDQVAEDSLIRSCVIERSGQEQKKLWYRVPANKQSALTEQADPFVLAVIFLAMREKSELVVHGTVSPSLLRNLDDFQAAWTSWLPERYARINIKADSEREPLTAGSLESAIAAFSGGVDSSFTVFRHKRSSGNTLRHDLRAAMMVHGFDIPLNQVDTFNRAAKRAQYMLDSLQIELIPVATNFRELKLEWQDCFAAAAASCLSLFQGAYQTGLLGSSEPYSSLVLPWGSNPVTDHLLSSESFRIVHDGAGFARSEKVREIARWPEGMSHLRVCWQGIRLDRNCGRCEKCIRTVLNFRVNNIALSESFERDVSDAQLLNMRVSNRAQLAELRQILEQVSRKTVDKNSWVVALKTCIKRNDRRLRLESALHRPAIKKLGEVVPWRVRSFISRYTESRSALPQRTFIVKDESEGLEPILRKILAIGDSALCKKVVAAVERDKRKTIKVLGDLPADPSPLPATRYRTEAEALTGCATPKVGGRLLFAVTSLVKPNRVVEIGTAHGYGALYIGSALRTLGKGKLLTLEGMTVRVNLSRAALGRFALCEYVEVLDGDFRITFDRAMEKASPLDLIFFDGDKDPENTRFQFAGALNAMDRGGYFMFDDINFSEEIRCIWSEILQLERVSGAITFHDRWGLIQVAPSSR